MARFASVRTSAGAVVCDTCLIAESPWLRTKGLLGRSGLDDDQGLWIPTGSIHMWGMRFPIDVVYADREGRVVKLVRGIKPWRMSVCLGAKVVGKVSHCRVTLPQRAGAGKIGRRAILQPAWRAVADQVAHDQTEIEAPA